VSDDAARWRWDATAWVPDDEPPDAPVAAADSWLVDAGRVRGWALHVRRFTAAAQAAGLEPAVAQAALAAAPGCVPATGRWFPRIDLRGGALTLAVRPAPPAVETVVAWPADGPDPRTDPRHKGPDLERLGALRDRAAARGAGEAVILDGDGRPLEGAYSSLLWWEDGTLCAVDDTAPILPGVTQALLLGLAAEAGVPVSRSRPELTDLAGREAWLTSARHGIRAVTAWADGPAAGPAPRAPEWQARLAALAEPWTGRGG
jgi:branched-subunit amino acid aminotransferase/4-amino-4-deoxychorismate lyase